MMFWGEQAQEGRHAHMGALLQSFAHLTYGFHQFMPHAYVSLTVFCGTRHSKLWIGGIHRPDRSFAPREFLPSR